MTQSFILSTHIFFGGLSLLGGALAMLAAKGSKAHRLSGKAFAYGMTVTALSAILLSLLKPNAFLLSIGFFTLYLNFSGWIWAMRTTQRKKVRMHYGIAIFGLTSGMILMYLSLQMQGLSTVILMTFGAIQLIMSVLDLWLPVRPGKNLSRHISKIGGAYIAATTAFLVASVSFVPPVLSWFCPTIVGTILITLAIRKLDVKHARE